MAALITDPSLEERLIAERQASGSDRWDEVWDGVYVMSPIPNVEHQRIVARLVSIFDEVIRPPVGGDVFPGLNVSDLDEGWLHNYRGPDVAVVLAGSQAEQFDAHYRGPVDFLVEIISPYDRTREKIPFYGRLGVRELLIVDRYPWSLELYRHQAGELVLAGRSVIERSEVIASTVLPVSFQLLPVEPRPQIRIVEHGTERVWVA